jgi:hypothetical protein
VAELQSVGAGFYGYYFGAVLTAAGQPVISSNVNVFESDGSTNAAVYLTSSLAANTLPLPANFTGGTTNVASTDAYGNLDFYAWPGQYVLAFSVAGVPTTITVTVLPWPADGVWNVVSDNSGTSFSPAWGDVRIATASGASMTYTLPSPSRGGRLTVIKADSSTHTVTVTAPSGSIIGGGGSFTNWLLYVQGQTAQVFSDGTNYYLVNVPPGGMPAGNLTLTGTAGNLASASTWAPFGTAGAFAQTVSGGMVAQTSLGYASLQVPVAGTYHCAGGVKWPTTSSVLVGGSVWKYSSGTGAVANGNVVYLPGSSTGPVTSTFAMDVACAAGDNLAIAGYNSASGQTCGTSQTWLDVRLVSY